MIQFFVQKNQKNFKEKFKESFKENFKEKFKESNIQKIRRIKRKN